METMNNRTAVVSDFVQQLVLLKIMPRRYTGYL